MGIFSSLKDKILLGDRADENDGREEMRTEFLISLGVLLWIVAESDSKFLPQEQEQIEKVLVECGEIGEDDMPIVLRAVEEANIMRVDVHSFTKEIRKVLEREARIGLVEQLFRVGCVDGDLAGAEHEMIRKITDLLGLDHKEFIDAKIKIKREFGLKTIEPQ